MFYIIFINIIYILYIYVKYNLIDMNLIYKNINNIINKNYLTVLTKLKSILFLVI